MPNAAKIEWPQGQPLFEVQWRAVAESLAGNGIQNPGDLNVTATSTALEIQVASGTAFYIGTEYTLGSAETHTLSAGDGTNDRWDTVYFDTATSSSGVREGTAAVNPEPPDVQGDELLLAVVYVPANATDVPDANVLNWRAQFSNEAEEVNYDDSTGAYSVTNVDAALDELQEAAQIGAYPLAIGDLDSPFGLPVITDMDVAGNDLSDGATVLYESSNGWFRNEVVQALANFTADEQFTSYPLPIGDLNSPYSLPNITDMDASGNDLNDSAGPGTIYDASASEIVQSVLGGPANSLTSYPLPIGDLNSPFALPNISDMDMAGNNLSDTSGPGTVYDATAQEIVQSVLGGPASSLTSYPLPIGDLNSPYSLPAISDMDAAGNDLVDGATTVWDTSESHVPREQVDHDRVTNSVAADYTTAAEELLFVDTSAPRTITLSTADTVEGRQIFIKDETGNANANSITIATEGTQTIDGATTESITKDYGAVKVASNGTNWFVISRV